MEFPRIAVIGLGRLGFFHAKTLSQMSNVRLVVADRDRDRSAKVATELGGEALSIEEVFSDAEAIDGVVIATPSATHLHFIERAYESGIDFFCEKPIATNFAELEAIEHVARRFSDSDVTSQIGFQRRFDPAYQAAKQAVLSGDIGDILRITTFTCDPEPPSEKFAATSGGIIMDCLVHDFDAIRWVTGREVTEVHALGSARLAPYCAKLQDVDEVAVLARLDDDTLVTMQASRNNGAGYDVRMELAASCATIAVGLDQKTPIRSLEQGISFPDDISWKDFLERFAPCYVRELEAFVRVVVDDEASPCSLADAIASTACAVAATASLRDGETKQIVGFMPHSNDLLMVGRK